jgi:hypothetical protein
MSIHVIGVFLFKKNKLLNNVLSKLYSYFIHKELQHSDDSIVCLADVIYSLETISSEKCINTFKELFTMPLTLKW